ncbi:hypothetical protein JTE90_004661 [Oedothorax gibbosus]|uniref:Uncharacterized protein n=1 Tax=Oedothorax gibbosus TaxID=931172 RepID=A0AAV6V015_9ARAC|nr:hypothetical protein JTE90_004661 [Oedothorax gibbosus]
MIPFVFWGKTRRRVRHVNYKFSSNVRRVVLARCFRAISQQQIFSRVMLVGTHVCIGWMDSCVYSAAKWNIVSLCAESSDPEIGKFHFDTHDIGRDKGATAFETFGDRVPAKGHLHSDWRIQQFHREVGGATIRANVRLEFRIC